MSVPVNLLLKAFVTQSSALSESDATTSPATLAQQLLYASRADTTVAALAEPAKRRLSVLTDRHTVGDSTPALFTRWSCFAPQSSLWNFRERVMAFAIDSSGDTAYASVGEGHVFTLALDDALNSPVEVWRGQDRVVSLALSPDDRYLAAGDGSGRLHVLTLDPDGPTTMALRGDVVHDAAINKIGWLDSARLITCGGDGRLILWHRDDDTSRLLGQRERRSLTSVVLAGDRVFTSDERGEIWSWSVDGGQGTWWSAVAPRPYLADMDIAPDGSFLYAAGPNGVHRWPVQAAEPRAEHLGSAGVRLWSIAVSPDGASLATADGSGSVLVWNAAGTGQHGRLAGTQARVVTALAWQPSGKLLRGARDGTTVSDWTATAEADVSSVGYGALWRMVATPDGSTVLIGTDRGLFRTSVAASSAGYRFDLISPGSVSELALIGDGTQAVYLVAGQMMLWDIDSGGEPVRVSSMSRDRLHVTAMAAVPGRRSVVVTVTLADNANEVQLWDFSRADVEIRSIDRHHSGSGRAVTVSPSGDWAVTAHSGRQVRIWSLRSEFRPRAVGFHRARVYSLAVTPDSGFIITGDETGRVAAWNSREAKMVVELQPVEFDRHVIRDLAVSPDGSWVACVTDRGEVSVWMWPLPADAPAAKLYPAIPAWRALALNDGLLLGDRRSSLTFVEVARNKNSEQPDGTEPSRVSTWPAKKATVVVIVDQWSSRNMCRRRKAAHMEFEALRRVLSEGQTCTALFALPQLPQLAGLRTVASKNGWGIYHLPVDRPGQVAELTRLIRHRSHSHHVVLLTDDPILSKLAAEEHLDVSVVNQPPESVFVF